MVVTYTIAGRQVGSHILSMATLGSVFGGIALWRATRSTPAQAARGASPPINAADKDEEAFIQEFLKNAQAEEEGKGKAKG